MIRVKDLKKSFGEVEVLKGISCGFEQGKTSLIIGQSGAGKTVFLKCLLGLFIPDSGEIAYDGLSTLEMSIKDRRNLRKQIGMVFQGSALFDSMDVNENVMFPLKMYSDMSKMEMQKRVDEVLERVNLRGSNTKYPSELSGGMQKRVAIARAIANKPKYLFCDEPNSGLDPKTAILIDNLIQEITRENEITTVINTHDMNSVMEIGEKIIFLKGGKMAWEGNCRQVFETDNEAVVDFVYSSELNKKVREAYQAEN